MDNNKLSLTDKSVSLSNPRELVEFASTLKKVIVEQQLFTKIQNKNYVNVEGWEFAGMAMGVLPVIESLTQIAPIDEEMKEIKYRAEVKLVHFATDKVVGYGVAICSNSEYGRNKQDEYVIASMAQTRATGKAYRNGFAWLLKMAGYETTPAEEMQPVSDSKEADKQSEKEKIKNGLGAK